MGFVEILKGVKQFELIPMQIKTHDNLMVFVFAGCQAYWWVVMSLVKMTENKSMLKTENKYG